jgi:hypothetical protein
MDSLPLMTTVLFYAGDNPVSISLLLQPLHMKTISTEGTPCTLLLIYDLHNICKCALWPVSVTSVHR